MNRFLTTLVQIFLALPAIWYAKELIQDFKKRKRSKT